MSTKKTIIALLIIFFVNTVILSLLYPQLPDVIATHWDVNGVANGFMGKQEGILFIPLLTVFLVIIFFIIPKIDPRAKNIQKFKDTFNLFIIGFVVFLLYVDDISLLVNLYPEINIMQLLSPAMAGFTYLLGILISSSEQNYSIGIRTPWTIDNKDVWDKTHKLGGKIFKWISLPALIGIILPQIGLFISFVGIILTSLFLVIYSYILHKKTV